MYYYDLESYTKSLFGSEAEYFFLWKLTAVHAPQHIRGFMQHLKASGNSLYQWRVACPYSCEA